MDWLVNTLYYVVPFVVLLGILVFVHEFGHYLMAKFSGVQVEAFSIGFGKQLWGFTDKSGTRWKISAIPLGGYCQFLGDADASSSTSDTAELTEEQKKKAFPYQSPLKKLLISVAGPAANYLFAILIFASIFFFLGKVEYPAVVGNVIPGGAAEKGGVLAKDKILKVNGKEVSNFEEIRREIDLNNEDKISLEIERAGKIINLSFPLMVMDMPENMAVNNGEKPRPMLGIQSVGGVEIKQVDMGLVDSFAEAVRETWNITDITLRGIGQMFTGKRSSDEVGGVIRIAEMSGDITKEQGWLSFVMFMALLSINLGLINLFPIPLLDGGHIVIYVLEMVFGKELNEKFKDGLFKFGFAVLISLMIFATWNDIVRLIHRWFA